MRKTERYAVLDEFRLPAAFLVVAIHVGPFSGVNETLDFYLTYVIGRIGVPFFLMVTGYFVLPGFEKKTYFGKVWQTVAKLGLVYLGVTVLYLPLTWYAGNLPEAPGELLRWLMLDGTFYHLWYLPAAMQGCLITAFLLSYLHPAAAGVISLLLYLVGVFGDSWYGLAVQAPLLRMLYSAFFEIGSFTRNGIFLAPVFLWMGAVLANGCAPVLKKSGIFAGFGISLCAMLAEGGFTRGMGWQRHNSMYLCLIPVMLSGFHSLLSVREEEEMLRLNLRRKEIPKVLRCIFAPDFLRKTAMWIYLLHPLCIVLVRGAAGVLGWGKVMVGNTMVLYLEVCVLSFAAGVSGTLLEGWFKGRRRKGECGHVQNGKGMD